MEIIGKLINKTKRATFPYHTFFLDALYLFWSSKYLTYTSLMSHPCLSPNPKTPCDSVFIFLVVFEIILYDLIQGVSKKSVIWKSGTVCFINQLSNDFHQINLITCKHLVHCGYFEYNTFSDDKVLTEIWLARHFDHRWCICLVHSFVEKS